MEWRKYREASPLTAGYEQVEAGVRMRLVPPFPFVAQIDTRILSAEQLAMVRRVGYRKVANSHEFFGATYVRPFSLWAVHIVVHGAHASLWAALHWLWDHHAIGLSCPPNQQIRLSDIRPYPFGRRRA
jgi:hypothetical protein